MRAKCMLFLFFFLLIFPVSTGSAVEATIESFSPQGTVKNVRQVTARFSEQMVSFGDPRLADPFEITCPEKGRGRWIDGRTWSYDFDRNLPAGVLCEFRLKDDTKTLSGKEMAGRKIFSFSSGGPAVLRARPYEGSTIIDERQVFILYLDADATSESVMENVFFSVEGITERVGVRILGPEESAELLKTPSIRRSTRGFEGRIILIQAKQSFPPLSAVKLIWGKGVTSRSEMATAADQVLAFKTRGPFKAEFSCSREKPGAGCIPVLPMTLQFTAPVKAKIAGGVTLTGETGKQWKPEWTDDEEDREYVYFLRFNGPFPEKTAFRMDIPKGITDDAGRPLANADKFPLEVRTDAYPPLAKFSARFGIIELAKNPLLPLTVRNIEKEIENRLLKVTHTLTGKVQKIPLDKEVNVIHWLQIVAGAKRDKSILREKEGVKTLSISKPAGLKSFEVLGVPLTGSGFYVVEMESRILGDHLLEKPAPLYVPAAALVTNLSAHFKWGRESSLVWVTTLDNGAPVKNASISIRDCSGKMHWKGKTDGKGIARISGKLPRGDSLPVCPGKINYSEASHALRGIGGGLFVFAKTDGDMTFTHSSWDEGIEPWRFQVIASSYGEQDGIIAHAVLDRTLLRAGETVHMKHVLRRHMAAGFTVPPASERPDEAVIEHQGSEQQYRFPVVWERNGSAESTWKIPESAKLGTYEITLIRKKRLPDNYDRRWHAGSFRVEEFRIPLMKGIIQGPSAPLVRSKDVTIDLSVNYLAGGGASSLPVKLRAAVQPRMVTFRDFDYFSFGGGRIREGMFRAGEIPEDGGEEYDGESAPPDDKPIRLKTQELQLGEAGNIRAKISGIPDTESPKDLYMEMEYRDPNGAVQTVSRKLPLYPSKRLVGISPDSWAAAKDALKYRVAVLDLRGNPVPDAMVTIDLFQRKTYSHRRRLVGGFYAYESSSEIKRIGRHFEGKTDARGLLLCEGASPEAGNVILHAEVRDEAGNIASANHDVWVAGKDDWWFEARNDDRMDVLPEKKRYEPGDMARFQVRMPFRSATALVAVEREGIVDVYTKRLSGRMPVIEIPVKKNYAPNVFVSVLAVRGRVAAAKPTAIFDPGKPAYKLGIAEIHVGWRAHELKVAVSTDQDVYKIREEMTAKVSARTADGKIPPKGSEAAIAVVDKGLLELMPNESWKLLEAMMRRRSYEVMTSTAQALVVGKRHFGLKALPQGGGGGKQITRELFDTLLIWKGRVPLNKTGEAQMKIPLNDALTSFRIIAVVTGGSGLFGTGEKDVRTSQELMLLSGIPHLVRDGDRFRAGFTVRNTTDRIMTVEIGLTIRNGRKDQAYPVTEISLPAGTSKEIGWEITTPPRTSDVGRLEYLVTAKEKNGAAADRLKVIQKVVAAVPIRTFQATLFQVTGGVQTDIERPGDALPGRGGIHILMRPRIGQGLSGVTEYMGRYSYTCLEQKVSKAIALRDQALWRQTLRDLPAYLDHDGLLKYFPGMRLGSDVLTAYVLSVAHEAGYVFPDDLREKMMRGLRGFINGKVVRYSALPTADLAIRKIAAVETLSRYGQAKAALLSSIPIEPNLWPTSAVIDWMGVLSRIGDIAEREKKMTEAQYILRSRMNLQGTTMLFSTERSDALWWLMASADGNAVRTLLTLLPYDNWKEDLPRIAVGALGRMHRGHWDTTTANAWGVLAMEKFSKKFESAPVTGESRAAMNGRVSYLDWTRNPEGGTLTFNWPAKRETLKVDHKGAGAPWAAIRSLAAVPLKAPFSSGYKIKKTIAPVEQKKEGHWTPGDVARVRLEIDAQADMSWVVASDPVPAGSTILGAGLGRDSALLRRGETSRGQVSEAFTERSFDTFRVYYEYVPKGTWTVEYTLRINNEGVFHLPETRVEALYAPEMFGEIPNSMFEVTR